MFIFQLEAIYIYVYVKSPLFWLLCWFKIVFKKNPHRTYDVSTVYPQRTYSVPTVYLQCTYSVPMVYLQRTYSVPTTYLQRTYGVPTTYLQCTYSVPTKSPLKPLPESPNLSLRA